MTRLKQWLAGAAALVGTGLTLSVALHQSMLDEGLTCAQIQGLAQEHLQRTEEFFVAIDGAHIGDVPEAFGTRVLGTRDVSPIPSGSAKTTGPGEVDGSTLLCLGVECARALVGAKWVVGPSGGALTIVSYDEQTGVVTINPPWGSQIPGGVDFQVANRRRRDMVLAMDGCRGEYRYRFEVSQDVNGWRVARTEAHPYLARSWELYAAANPDDVLFWRGYSEAPTVCRARFTAGQCLAALRAVNDCFVLEDGRLCRYGAYPAPDENGNPVSCVADINAQAKWHPCEVKLGQVPETLRDTPVPDLAEWDDEP